jgi:phospholipid/cholesterol/gamma-HCH transport system substrate-binding protein
VKNRLLGVAFVILLVAGLTLSVLQYKKTFTPVDWVTLRADRTGMQLNPGAEVKLRGVVVGEVREIGTDGGGARLRLALNPDLTPMIPAAVTARLLPKTLFGERYVALIPPPGEAGPALRPGAVIGQDRTAAGVELERVLDEALPLLQAVDPETLAATLGALATALDGRGDRTGEDLVTADRYLADLNRSMPTIAEDVRRLAAVLDIYDAALPDLLSILRDTTVTMNTVVDQRAQLATFLADTTGVADTTTAFLTRHGDQLIRVGAVSRPVLELLAEYAPEYPCLTRGLVALKPRVSEVFSTGRMHITLEVTKDGGKYERGRDEPVYGAKDGPRCYGLPHPPVPAPAYYINDGYDYGGERSSPPQVVGTPGTAAAAGPGPSMGYAGTKQEQDLVKPIVGAATGAPPVEVPDIAVLLWGPLLRGAVVNMP